MPRLPQEKIDEIRASVDITDVIGNYLTLTKKGNSYRALCPFHNDNDPSLMISPQKQIYHCFVCGNGGNVFTFLQRYLHISFMEALQQVADLGHVDLSDYQFRSQQTVVDEKLQPLYQMHKEAAALYTYYLNTKAGTAARDYLTRRGFDDALIQEFGIGYAPDRSILYNAFKKLGFQEIDMHKSGLVLESNRQQDRFYDRIMFPLHDESGRIVGFSGRMYRQGAQGGKYINSPESEIFIKGRVLYNYHRALEPAKRAGFVYINEGFMDVIAMHRAGHDNVIALMGTALTQSHLRLLKRMGKKVVLCLDGDQAGQAAAIKSAQILEQAQFDVDMVLLPEGRDPDEIFTAEGKSGLDAILRQTKKSIDFRLDYETARLDLNNYDNRKALLQAGIDAIATLKDDIDRAYYIEQLAKRTSFSEATIRDALHRKQPVEAPVDDYYDVATQVHDARLLVDKYTKAERNLIYYMLKDKAIASRYEAEVGFMYNDAYRVLASYIVDYYRNHQQMNEADLMDRLNGQSQLVNTLAEIMQSELPDPCEKKAIDDYIYTISKNAVRLKKEQLREQFNYVLEPAAKAEILKEMIALDKEYK